MDAVDCVKYLNPLTVEAQMFLNSMQTLENTSNEVDVHLINTLEEIVAAIDKFLEQKLSPIVATKNTELIAPQEINQIIRVFHCSECRVDLGKTAEKAAIHLVDGHKVRMQDAKPKRKNERDKRPRIVIKLPKKASALLRTDLSKYFIEHILISEKLKRLPEYDVIENELSALIKPLFPEQAVKIYKFGSRITGIGTSNSDLDLYVDIGNTFSNFLNRASNETLQNLERVCNILKNNTEDWKYLVAIKGARVPILKVCHSATGIDCDIGFSNSLGPCNSKLMEHLFELQPMARRMCLFLKKWLERSKMTEAISTYSISLMVIYFLQIKRYLPPIEKLQNGLSKPVYIGPWIINFKYQKLKDFNMETVEVGDENSILCIKNFFEFYSKFDFDGNAVCPYLGKIIDNAHIEEEMPQRYHVYVQNTSDPADKDRSLQSKKCMVIQDPIQLNHNVSKGVSPNVLKTLLGYFKQSFELIA